MIDKEKTADNNSSPEESFDHSEISNPSENSQEKEAVEEVDAAAPVESDLERLTRELAESKDKHLRLYSEFENFRRRTAKERLELIGSANADLISALLPVVDDLERAQKAAEGDPALDSLQEGTNLIYQKLTKELFQKGLKPMDNLVGKGFDAEVHEAISKIPAPKKSLKNCIVDVVEKGYYLNDKVIRYAKVVIGT